MSFDTIFDYSNALVTIDEMISNQNAIIASLDTQITDVQALPAGYNDMKTSKENSLNSLKTIETSVLNNAQSVKDEILALTSLSSGDKQSLYDFWQLAGESKRSWMQRMMYNTKSGTLITDAAALLADGALDTQSKQQLAASLVCGKYPINRNSFLVFNQL